MAPDDAARSAPRAQGLGGLDRACLMGCAAACLALVVAGLYPVNNPDTYGHLAQGRQIMELGGVPSHDTLSFWRPEPARWNNYEWLSDALSWALYEAGGPNALLALKCATLALAGALLAALAWLFAGPRAAALCALLLVVAIPAARFRFTERPHLVAMPLVALYLIGLSYLLRAWGRPSRRATGAWVAAFFVLHVTWVNLHGSHLLGLAITAIHVYFGFVLCESRGALAAVFGLQLLASCVSPYGPAIVLDAIAHTLDPAYRQIVTEWEPWKPTDPFWLMGAPVLQSGLLACAVRPLWRRGPAGRALLASSCLLALAAFRSIRFVAEYLLLSAPAIAVGLHAGLGALTPRRFARAALLAFLAAATLAVWAAPRLPPYQGLGAGQSDVGLPAATGRWLARHAVAPRVFAAVEDAWYLMFAAPKARFLVDGRIPFYGPEHIARVRRAFADPTQLRALLTQYDVDTVVVRHTFAPQRQLLATMRDHKGFRLVAIEDRYALFVRADVPLRGGALPQPLPLSPGYELPWLLAADPAREREILAALAQLPQHDNARGYAGWVRAMIALKPLLRGGQDNGLHPVIGEAARETLARAEGLLARAAVGAGGAPIVHAFRALVATERCDLDTAEHALAQARWEGESRETLLGSQELALRRGRLDEVRAFLDRALAMPGAEGDLWLTALQGQLQQPPRCAVAQ